LRKLVLVLVTVLATVLVTLLVLNLRGGGGARIERPLEPAAAVGEPQFLRDMGTLLGPPVVDGNQVTGLNNGDEIFPVMLAAIRAARSTITFETYIYWSGRIGREFAEALSERARAGVRVHVLMDWVGSEKMDERLLREMEASGVQIRRFHPLHWYTLSRINNRTHRKLLVVDGRVGFTGGVGIADPWLGHAQDRDHWRDSHYRVEGPAVGRCSPPSWTTGWRRRGRSCTARGTSPPSSPPEGAGPRS
jgi:cardiolipin synthase